MAMTLRLTESEQALLRELADEDGLSQNEVIRRALLEHAERRRLHSDVHAAGARAVSRYSALLDRLSK